MKRKKARIQVNTLPLARMWPRLTEQQRTQVAEMHIHYETEFVRLRADENQIGLAASVNDIVSGFVTRSLAQDENAHRIACRQGCNHCCYQNVSITKPEALLLLAVAESDGVPIDWDKAQRQARHGGANKWTKQTPDDMRCVFLNDAGACSVYEHRPTACRKLFALDNSEQCDIVSNPGGETVNLISVEAEIVASAAIGTFQTGSLPVMLLQLRDETNKPE